MRILYFSRDYTTHDRRFLAAISEKHDVFFLRLENDGASYEKRPVPAPVQVVSWAAGRDRLAGPESWLKLMPDYLKVIDRVRPDLIHSGPIQSCGFMTALAGFHPFLLASWGSDLLVDADRNEFWGWMTSFALSHSDLLLCDCAEVSEKARTFGNCQASQIVEFPWGVDHTKFHPVSIPGLGDRVSPRDSVVVISTRAWRHDYGTDVLLEAFRLAHEREARLRLILLGGGPLEPEVRAYIDRHRLAEVVDLRGLLPEEDLPAYFQSADLYLSCAPSDGSSISLLGAMACGLPVIVADRPSNREWVKDESNGWRARAGEPESFAQALVEAARLDPARRRTIASANRRITAERANWESNFPKLLSAYERLLDAHRKSPLKGADATIVHPAPMKV